MTEFDQYVKKIEEFIAYKCCKGARKKLGQYALIWQDEKSLEY